MPQLLRPEEAALELSLPRTTVFQLMRDGSLPSLKVGRRRLVPATAIEAFILRKVKEQAGGAQ